MMTDQSFTSAGKFAGPTMSGKGWTSGGVIEAFHPGGIEEWGPAPPRYGGTLQCTDWADVVNSGRPVAVLAGQSQISTPVLDGPGRPDGLLPRRRDRTGQRGDAAEDNERKATVPPELHIARPGRRARREISFPTYNI